MTENDQTESQARRGVTRRQALGMGAAAAGAVAAGSILRAGPGIGRHRRSRPLRAAPRWRRRCSTAPPAPAATGRSCPGPGEPTIVRGDLLDGATRGSGSRNALVAFAQFTDMHIIDAQSPARVEFLDRFNDPGNPLASSAPFSSAYRPWEMLTAHVAEAMVRAVNSLTGAPVTGHPLDFTISTGDNSDNTQYNEIRWHIDLLDGAKTIRPDSGSTAKWEGVGDKYDFDTSYWHPDGKPLLSSVDNYRAKYGYPSVPGLLDALPAAVHLDRPADALVQRVRQPRRPGAGHRPVARPHRRGRHRRR